MLCCGRSESLAAPRAAVSRYRSDWISSYGCMRSRRICASSRARLRSLKPERAPAALAWIAVVVIESPRETTRASSSTRVASTSAARIVVLSSGAAARAAPRYSRATVIALEATSDNSDCFHDQQRSG